MTISFISHRSYTDFIYLYFALSAYILVFYDKLCRVYIPRYHGYFSRLWLHFFFQISITFDINKIFESHDLINTFIIYRQFAAFRFPDDHAKFGFLNRYGHIIFLLPIQTCAGVSVDYLHLRILLLIINSRLFLVPYSVSSISTFHLFDNLVHDDIE